MIWQMQGSYSNWSCWRGGSSYGTTIAEHGWSTILCDRTDEVETQAEDLSAEFGPLCLGIQMNLTNDDEVDSVVRRAFGLGISLKFLGLIAAINHPAMSIEPMDMAVWIRSSTSTFEPTSSLSAHACHC